MVGVLFGPQVHVFEDFVESGNVVGAFLEAVFDLRQTVFDDLVEEANVSLPVELVEFMRLLNPTSLSRTDLRSVVLVLEVLARVRGGVGGSELVGRLSEEDCRRILARFQEDNEWINDTFFGGRREGLFPSEIRSRSVMPALSPESCADIFAEMLTAEAIRLES